jgi:uncharacterized protein YuzE
MPEYKLILLNSEHLDKFVDSHYNMHYDQESNLLSIEVGKGAISHAREFGNFIIHLSANGKPLLIEILDANKFVKQFDKIKINKKLEKIVPIS